MQCSTTELPSHMDRSSIVPVRNNVNDKDAQRCLLLGENQQVIVYVLLFAGYCETRN